MKKQLILFIVLILLFTLAGCQQEPASQVAATTAPVYYFASRLCENTGIQVVRLVTEEVSCLHDYTLQVRQMQAIESAEVLIISGAGLEAFLDDVLTQDEKILDASEGIELICLSDTHDHDHDHSHSHDHGHDHSHDPHIWLSISNAKAMCQNIFEGLSMRYPDHKETFSKNFEMLSDQLSTLAAYANTQLQDLSCRELITFHDGFAYFAQNMNLTILAAIEEESGSEASASELKQLIEMVRSHNIPAIFTEVNGSSGSAQVIAAETGCQVFALDMGMGQTDYFQAMYHNIDTIKEALQ